MKQTKIYCDFCKKEIKYEKHHSHFSINLFTSGKTDDIWKDTWTEEVNDEFDICQNCMKTLVAPIYALAEKDECCHRKDRVCHYFGEKE